MKLTIFSFTQKGAQLSEHLTRKCNNAKDAVEQYCVAAYALTGQIPFVKLSSCIQECFAFSDGLIFIGAAGIAVRAIAPYLQSKDKDSAVVVIREDSRYVISLLSGHLGGANELTDRLAKMLQAMPIITTATDTRGVFSIDLFAKKNDLIFSELSMIKKVSGALLQGESVGFISEYPVVGEWPEGFCEIEQKLTIHIRGRLEEESIITEKSLKNEKEIVTLLPRNMVAGIGCRRGIPYERLLGFLNETMSQHGFDIRRIEKICSLDRKSDEAGLVALAKELNVPFQCFSEQELKQVAGNFTASDFVKETVGVDNVCERSACLGSDHGTVLLKKQAKNGMTISLWERKMTIMFTA